MNQYQTGLPTGIKRWFLMAVLATGGCGGEAGTGAVNGVLTEPGSPAATYRLAGTVHARPDTAVDGDTNDPQAAYFNNNGESAGSIQSIPGRVLLSGFVTAVPTGIAGDRFATMPDENDVFRASLARGHFVSLQNPDFMSADCDLYLYRESDMMLVASSTTAGEFDSVSVPADDTYIIVVNAVRGSAGYLLSIDTTSMMPGIARFGQKADFKPDTAIVQLDEVHASADMATAEALQSRLQVSLSHRNPRRAALARFNRINPQTRAALQLQPVKDGFEAWLAQRNRTSFDRLETLHAIKSLAGEKGILRAEPNYRMYIQQTAASDPTFGFQWYLPAVDVGAAWNTTVGSGDVLVAVVDTGIYSAHPDLQGQLVPGYDFIVNPDVSRDGDGLDPDPEDVGDSNVIGESSWHGTHVAGIIAAMDNNGQGMVGTAPGVKVMPLRAVGFGGADSYDVMQAVRYAAGLDNDSGTVPSRPADIINLSLGGGSYSASSQELFNVLFDLGVMTVAAGGNEATTEPFYPAAYNQVLSVAATDLDGKPAPYTNFGQFIDLAAPGGDLAQDLNADGHPDGVLSLSVNESVDGVRSPGYVFSHGTSAATPIVAGTLALMKSVYPDITQADIYGLLRSGALTGNAVHSGPLGYGIINASNAVAAAVNLSNADRTTTLVADPGNLKIGSLESHRGFTVVTAGTMGAGGEAGLAVNRIVVPVDWLSVKAVDVDRNGLGDYIATVDRSRLAPGRYTGQLDIHASDGSMVLLEVTVQVAEVEAPGDAGTIYAGLFDAVSLQLVDAVRVEARDGLYPYVFEGVAAGHYYVVAGPDINNDLSLCGRAENCGVYPTLLDPAPVALSRTVDDVDFSLEGFPPPGIPAIPIDGGGTGITVLGAPVRQDD